MTLVATQVKRRRGTNDENDAFAGAEGEITVDLTNKELRVHDGSGKTGGFRIGRHTDRTNCIVKIPQDIKFTLSNGVLTLKAGSVCYKCNGSFTKATTTTDLSITATTLSDGQRVVFTNAFNYIDSVALNGGYVSSATEPSGGLIWFNTTNNITYTGGAGNWAQSLNMCLPLAVVTVSGGIITRIDQVFNGFGFMDKTIFMLPNVRILKPNGRHADGTPKNIISTTTNVLLNSTYRPSITGYLIYNPAGAIQKSAIRTNWYYDERNNYVSTLSGDTSWAIWGTFQTDANDRITSFNPKFVFNSLDYSDTEYMAHQAMPSDKYINLTLGANGSTYTAPADGYFTIRGSATASGGYVVLSNEAKQMTNNPVAYNPGGGVSAFLPVAKGDIVYVWTGNYSGTLFRFVYANGAK